MKKQIKNKEQIVSMKIVLHILKTSKNITPVAVLNVEEKIKRCNTEKNEIKMIKI